MNSQQISIPEQPPLFADYLRRDPRLAAFFPTHFLDFPKTAPPADRTFAAPRQEISDILQRQNRDWGAPQKSLQNAELIAAENTLAVVTGQQAGILGGPLYTFYKTITVLKLVEELQRRHPQFHFVPVFWMEVNDSDFTEIGALRYLTRENTLRHLVAAEAADEKNRAVAARRIDPQIKTWRAEIENDLFETEFREEVLNLFFGCYQNTAGYADAFACLLLKFFGERGLVVFNPADEEAARSGAPLLRRALESRRELHAALEARNRELEELRYPPQIRVQPEQTLLFYHDEAGQRVRIDQQGQDFSLKYPADSRGLSEAELLQMCDAHPERFSANVALRPLLQDYLLPTVAYVAGPSEVAYFAQVSALYQFMKMPMPVIYPRHRVTLVESKIHKSVEKFGLPYADILSRRSDLKESFLRTREGSALLQTLEDSGEKISSTLRDLQQQLAAFDPTLKNSVEKTRKSIEDNFGRLSGKVMRSLEERNAVETRQLERVLTHLLPEANFQERVLNPMYFCIKYGLNFVNELYEALPAETTSHHLIFL